MADKDIDMSDVLFPIDVIEATVIPPPPPPDGELWLVCGIYHTSKEWGHRVVGVGEGRPPYGREREFHDATPQERAEMIARIMAANGWNYLRIVRIPLKG